MTRTAAIAGSALALVLAMAGTSTAQSGKAPLEEPWPGHATEHGDSPRAFRGGAQGDSPALDTRLIQGMRSKDHTVAVKKIKIRLVSAPSKTVWTSTSRTVSVPMTFEITDPKRVAKRIRICTELVYEDDYWCKSQTLKSYSKPGGDFSMTKTAKGWRIHSAPYYKGVSPATCFRWEYYRPKVKRHVWVVDPRNGDDLVSAQFGWTVRCSG